MIEYLTTGIIVLLLYAAVIGVLILIGGEDELLATYDADERDGEALSDTEVLQDGCIKPDGDCARCCASEYCNAIFTKGARAKDGND